MDGITLIEIIAGMNAPIYALVIHNAVQTRLNKKLLERLNGINQDEEDEKEEKDERS